MLGKINDDIKLFCKCIGVALAIPLVIIAVGLSVLITVLLALLTVIGRIVNFLLGNHTKSYEIGYPFFPTGSDQHDVN